MEIRTQVSRPQRASIHFNYLLFSKAGNANIFFVCFLFENVEVSELRWFS